MDDIEFLQWMHDRLVNVHKENINYDYMHRLRDLIAKYPIKKQRFINLGDIFIGMMLGAALLAILISTSI